MNLLWKNVVEFLIFAILTKLMLKFSEIPTEIANKIEVIFCDIDDTLSFEGKILPETYSSPYSIRC